MIILTLKMEAIHSSETYNLIVAIRSHILENDILHSHHRENLKYYMIKFV
jgi:hypothetical protein